MRSKPLVDLFGNERPATEAPQGITLSLFDATAERLAFESGRPVSQERTEIVNGGADATAT